MVSRRAWVFAVALVALVGGCRGSEASGVKGAREREEAGTLNRNDAASTVPPSSPPPELGCLTAHYPGRAVMTGTASSPAWALELPDGTRIPYDDGRTKATAERIISPDVEDIFALKYPKGPIAPVTNEEQDPGRVRLEPLFRAAYGANEREVAAVLAPVKLVGKTVRFHRAAAPALERVNARLEKLIGAEPTLERYFRDLGGTFAARTIAGTDQTSAHAWGIAIDIDTSMSDYWRNAPNRPWRNRIPAAIVDAFEAEGFIWGGRWFHYDTMHFEYRPELFEPPCRASPLRR